MGWQKPEKTLFALSRLCESLTAFLIVLGASSAYAQPICPPLGEGENLEAEMVDPEYEGYSRLLYRRWSGLAWREDYFSESIPQGGELEAMRSWVSEQVDPDPIKLIKRQHNIYFRNKLRPYPLAKKVLAGTFGNLRPIHCLEALLYEEHLSLHPQWGRKTEFVASVLRHPETHIIEIHFVSADRREIGASYTDQARENIQQRQQGGWSVVFQIHNHPFDFDVSYKDIAGTPVPSEADMQHRYDVPNVITNGFHSLAY